MKVYLESEHLRKKRIGLKKQEGDITDPFEAYGYGILAYFDMLRFLIGVFSVICILYLPIMYMYQNNNVMNTF